METILEVERRDVGQEELERKREKMGVNGGMRKLRVFFGIGEDGKR